MGLRDEDKLSQTIAVEELELTFRR